MQTEHDELISKDVTIRKLQLQIAEIQRKNAIDIQALKSEIYEYRERVEECKANIQPLKESINKLTSERGKWLRKLRRHDIDI